MSLLSNGERLLAWPLKSHVITAGWTYSDGSSHRAIDLRAAVGDPVYAAEDGTVSWVQKWDGNTKTGNQSYGNLVRLDHNPYNGKNLQTYYAHLNQTLVNQGQKVKEGDLIGYAGNTGNSFGSHLHFEVRLNGNRLNPLNWLDNDFTCSNAGVWGRLGNYTSVKIPEQDLKPEEPEMPVIIGDKVKIGPASTGDKAVLKVLLDTLIISYKEEGDYLIAGPMSGGDKNTVLKKCNELKLSYGEYIETPTEPEEPEIPEEPEETEKKLYIKNLEKEQLDLLKAMIALFK